MRFQRTMPWLRGCSTRSLGPFQTDTNVAGHSIRPVDDLKSELVTERTKSPGPELVHIPRQASESLFPTGLLLVDRASVVGAKLIREAVNLHLREAIRHCAVNNYRDALHSLFVRNARWLGDLIDQEFFLCLRLSLSAYRCIGLLC